MIQERIDIAVAARPETVLEVLKDVESVDRWLRPHLPAWPPVTSNMTVVESRGWCERSVPPWESRMIP
ncbi:Uncharacterised protein [Mycobacteroides abscessus subsp. abscessus]|nr:Uncharacterised protein [Mycobacteroides abscessus subsp. abscessus]